MVCRRFQGILFDTQGRSSRRSLGGFGETRIQVRIDRRLELIDDIAIAASKLKVEDVLLKVVDCLGRLTKNRGHGVNDGVDKLMA